MGHSKFKMWEDTMSQGKSLLKCIVGTIAAASAGLAINVPLALAGSVDKISYSTLSGNDVQIKVTLSEPAPKATSFTITNPARLAVDLPDTTLNLEDKIISVDSGIVKNVRAVEAGGRTRLVVNLVKVVPYELRTANNELFISFVDTTGGAQAVAPVGGAVAESAIKDVDFKRGVDGSAVVSVAMTDANASINVGKKGNKVVVDFYGMQLPEELSRRLEVTDFATPAQYVDFFQTNAGARLAVTASGDYEHLAYQTGSEYTLEIKPISEEEVKEAKKDALGYSGEKLSLNFQNIEVRAVLQLIADFTGLNVVASDSVQGNITLRLKNVPWDQALDIILKTRGLGMRQSGNVVLIAPNEELVEREKRELEAQQQKVELAPLQTEFYTINYAKAADIASLLKAEANSILTARGNVTIDERTNTLMVLETADKHNEVAKLIEQLDVPISQVMIESRIVIASDDFSKEIGVRTGVSAYDSYDDIKNDTGAVATTGTSPGADTMVFGGPGVYPGVGSRYNVNLPAASGGAPSIALGILGHNYLLDLELSALQTEGRGEVISNPRVVTSNQMRAEIKQGVEIPYQEASSSGATSVSFKEAVLSLAVTPQITPDDRVVMDLEVSKDSVGGIYAGVPSINTRAVNTQVLVDNGDTVVLGGIYETEKVQGVSKVPLLGDIPLLGFLFRSKTNTESKAELLVFVTPKILKEGLTAAVE